MAAAEHKDNLTFVTLALINRNLKKKKKKTASDQFSITSKVYEIGSTEGTYI